MIGTSLPPAAEAMYFDGAPVAHIVEHEERQRLQRIAENGREAVRRRGTLRLAFGGRS